jgi:hypothetical protein
VVTRPVRFSGAHLFVNGSLGGSLRAEVLDRGGRVVPGYELSDSVPLRGDAARMAVRWKQRQDLRELAGEVVRFRFVLDRAALFAFWISATSAGRSGGYVAAGGPGFSATRDR